MSKIYNLTIRKEVINLLETKQSSVSNISEEFRINRSTISRWRKRYEETGSLDIKINLTKKRRIDHEAVRKTASENPNFKLKDLANMYKCTAMNIYYILKRK